MKKTKSSHCNISSSGKFISHEVAAYVGYPYAVLLERERRRADLVTPVLPALILLHDQSLDHLFQIIVVFL